MYVAHCSSFSETLASRNRKLKTNTPSEKRDHGDNRSSERPVDYYRQLEDREQTIHELPLVAVNPVSLAAAKTMTHGAVPIELSAPVQRKIVCQGE